MREEGASIMLGPVQLAPGTYRVVYVADPAAISGDVTAYAVPEGFEDVITERVAARVRERDEDDPSLHLRRADATWTELLRPLRKRYGRHGVPGIRQVRRW